jgi:hypothetical protein
MLVALIRWATTAASALTATVVTDTLARISMSVLRGHITATHTHDAPTATVGTSAVAMQAGLAMATVAATLTSAC